MKDERKPIQEETFGDVYSVECPDEAKSKCGVCGTASSAAEDHLYVAKVRVRRMLGKSDDDPQWTLSPMLSQLEAKLKRLSAAALSPAQAAPSDESDKEQARWQKEIYALLRKHVPMPDSIDGGGSDSGDPLDFTLAEIEQALIQFRCTHLPAVDCGHCGAKDVAFAHLETCSSNPENAGEPLYCAGCTGNYWESPIYHQPPMHRKGEAAAPAAAPERSNVILCGTMTDGGIAKCMDHPDCPRCAPFSPPSASAEQIEIERKALMELVEQQVTPKVLNIVSTVFLNLRASPEKGQR